MVLGGGILSSHAIYLCFKLVLSLIVSAFIISSAFSFIDGIENWLLKDIPIERQGCSYGLVAAICWVTLQHLASPMAFNTSDFMCLNLFIYGPILSIFTCS